ncbi:hypothetical protein MBLNU230_g1580t2 [Neophaeotheca triangularis]
MGKSRSATCVSAYLMHRHLITPEEALAQIRQARPLCEPNEGFAQQLDLYHKMATPDDIEAQPPYQRWLYLREVELSRACGQAPEADKIRFEDEHGAESAADGEVEFRCRKCRRPLATSQYLTPHPPHQSPHTHAPSKNPAGTSTSAEACAHHFLDPLSWMRPELEQGKLDGRLECPKCRANVGKYAWQGMQCSCGEWVVPGISLSKGKLDEVRKAVGGGGGMGIRMPPGVGGRKSGQGAGNL